MSTPENHEANRSPTSFTIKTKSTSVDEGEKSNSTSRVEDDNSLLWSTLADRIQYMYITAASEDERAGNSTTTTKYKYNDNSKTTKSSFWLSTYNFKKILLFCGVKTHRCSSAVQHFFVDLFRQCYPPPTALGDEDALDGNEAGSGEKEEGRGPRRGRAYGRSRASGGGGSTAPLVVVKRIPLPTDKDAVLGFLPEETLFTLCPSLVDRSLGSPHSDTTTVSVEELLVAQVSASSTVQPLSLDKSGNKDNKNGWMEAGECASDLLGGGAPHPPKMEYIFVIHANYFEECVIHLLTAELRGQMITQFPFVRFTAASLLVGRGGAHAVTGTAATTPTTRTQKHAHNYNTNRPKSKDNADPNAIAGVVIFLSGTSGTGKSTLASLIATQLSIDEVLSTDTIRQVVRLHVRQEEGEEAAAERSADLPTTTPGRSHVPLACPEVFYSTYDAYKAKWAAEAAQEEEGKRRRTLPVATTSEETALFAEEREPSEEEVISSYKKQCHCVLASLDKFIDRYFASTTRAEENDATAAATTTITTTTKRRTLLVEGAHLLPSYLKAKQKDLMRKQVLCINVLARIKKEERHRERFCVRSRGMALSLKPKQNKYVCAFRFIRQIQGELLAQAMASTKSSVEECYPFVLANDKGNQAQQQQQQSEKGPTPPRTPNTKSRSSIVANGNHSNNNNNNSQHHRGSYDSFLILNNTNIDKSLSYVHRAVLHFVESVSLFGWSELLWREETVEPPVKEKKMLSILFQRQQQQQQQQQEQRMGEEEKEVEGTRSGPTRIAVPVEGSSSSSKQYQREARDRTYASPIFFQTSGLSRARSAQRIENFQMDLLQQSRAAANVPPSRPFPSMLPSFYANANTHQNNNNNNNANGDVRRKKNEITSTAASTGAQTLEGKPNGSVQFNTLNSSTPQDKEKEKEIATTVTGHRIRAHSTGHLQHLARDMANDDEDDEDDDFPSLVE